MDFSYHHDYYYDYGYPGTQGMSDTMFNTALAIVMIFITVSLIIRLAAYIMHSYGLYTIAKRQDVKYLWMAFIPYARDYLYGEVSGEVRLKKKTIRQPGLWRLLMPIASGAIFSILCFVSVVLMGIGGALVDTIGAISGSLVLSAIALFAMTGIFAVLYHAAYKVLCILMDLQIYGRFTEGKMPVVHALLSAFVPLYGAVCMIIMCGRPFLNSDGAQRNVGENAATECDGAETDLPESE